MGLQGAKMAEFADMDGSKASGAPSFVFDAVDDKHTQACDLG
jgi:hypothetical protein